METDPARALAEHVCNTAFSDLPDTAVRAARRDILDTLGAMLGGSAAPGIESLAGLTRRWWGKPESSLLIVGGRAPAPQAAWVNAAMGHALDFDDTYDRGGSMHPGVSTLAASLAVAEMLGGVTGRELLLAVTLGLDVSCRLALAATAERGWHRTSAIGIFGATAAAGKLLRLDAEQMPHALGIAYSQAAGNRQCILDGALTKRLQAGQAASAAVLSALLAQEGLTGTRHTFAGQFGFFPLYQPDGYDLTAITDGLGTDFRGTEISFKPYPCGRNNHAIIDAALRLHDELDLSGVHDDAAIAEVTVTTNSRTHDREFGPNAVRRPTQVVEAQFSAPFLIATALVRGQVGIGDVSRVDHPAVLALADRMQAHVDPEASPGWSRLMVRLADGRVATVETTLPSGSPANPLSDAQLEAKFRDCAAHAARPLPGETIDRALDLLRHLDEAADATALVRLFV
jgi:2-methylcitrate dehydratase PrpD